MAIPSRFLKPANKPTKGPRKSSWRINPTFVGVLLSIGAHALIILFAPRANFSFAALSEAAQQQDLEETIVPVVELTPAERSRLPSFAQPRRLPPTPTGLDSLSLPSGLPNVSRTPLPPRRNTRNNQTATSTARRLPSATTSNQARQRLQQNFRRAPLSSGSSFDPNSVRNRDTPRTPNASEFVQIDPSGLPILGNPDNVAVAPVPSGDSTNNSPSSNGGSASDLETTTPSGDLLAEVIARQNADNAESSTGAQGGIETPPLENETESGTEIAIETEAVEPAPAQGNPRRLLDAYEYDPAGVDEETAAENLQAWLVATAENKSNLETGNAELTIDSQFKVCKDNAPASGLIGVIVNPDGSQEDAKVLKSIGYDVLNRQALSAVEYTDFGQPERPTQYQVVVDVVYEPEGCVESLPEVEGETTEAP